MSTTSTVATGKKKKVTSHSRITGADLIDPITGEEIPAGEGIHLRGRRWWRKSLLRNIAEQLKTVTYPVWPDTGTRIHGDDLLELGIESDEVPVHPDEESDALVDERYLRPLDEQSGQTTLPSGKKVGQSRHRNAEGDLDPITGRAIPQDDRVRLRGRWWGRTSLLKYIAEENKDMYPVWPDTGARISRSDLAKLGVDVAGLMSDDDEPVEDTRPLHVQTGLGHGLGLGLGAGLVGGALLGSSLGYRPYGLYGPYGYGGPYYGGGYYSGGPVIVEPGPLGRRRVVVAGRGNDRSKYAPERDYDHPETVMERLRRQYERRKKNGEFTKTDARGTGRHPHHKANGEFSRSDTRPKGGHRQARSANGEYTVRSVNKYWENEYEPSTRVAMLREHLEPNFWHENWHETYDLMPEKDREMVQAEIKRILADCPTAGRIEDSVEANRLMEKGFAPYVDYFTGERGILPHDLIRVGGRCVSRHGYILWLEDHRHDEVPPRLFERDLIEEDLEPLEVEPREYHFFRPRRLDENTTIHTTNKHREGGKIDDDMRRRARKYKEDYDAGRIKVTRSELRDLPFYEYLDKDEWEDLE